MSKRRLTKKQHARIQKRHTASVHSVSETDLAQAIAAGQLGAEQKGLVVSYYGKYADVETTESELVRCMVRQNLTTFVVGDEVIWRPGPNQTGIITAVCPRHGVIFRESEGKKKLIAANVDSLNIVTAPLPLPNFLLVDSYLVAANYFGIAAMIVLNKKDLIQSTDEFMSRFQYYKTLVTNYLETSIFDVDDLNLLQEQLTGKISIFVGQSGVGKSSLLNLLVPAAKQITASQMHQHGRHTTTTSKLYHLKNSGRVIDSPGMRDFKLDFLEIPQIAYGYREFVPYIEQCQFRNCNHLKEPGCAVRQAVAQKKIALWRYENYQHLIKEKK